MGSQISSCQASALAKFRIRCFTLFKPLFGSSQLQTPSDEEPETLAKYSQGNVDGVVDGLTEASWRISHSPTPYSSRASVKKNNDYCLEI